MSGGFVPGALAVIVGPICADSGKLVELVKPAVRGEVVDPSRPEVVGATLDSWVVKSLGRPILSRTYAGIISGQVCVVEKFRLKISGNSTGKDETLEWMPLNINKQLESLT